MNQMTVFMEMMGYGPPIVQLPPGAAEALTEQSLRWATDQYVSGKIGVEEFEVLIERELMRDYTVPVGR